MLHFSRFKYYCSNLIDKLINWILACETLNQIVSPNVFLICSVYFKELFPMKQPPFKKINGTKTVLLGHHLSFVKQSKKALFSNHSILPFHCESTSNHLLHQNTLYFGAWQMFTFQQLSTWFCHVDWHKLTLTIHD